MSTPLLDDAMGLRRVKIKAKNKMSDKCMMMVNYGPNRSEREHCAVSSGDVVDCVSVWYSRSLTFVTQIVQQQQWK